MITLAFHFPQRRYHATPWDRYVNEGAVEVPPAPWRILRTLYAVWRQRHPEIDADTMHPILRQLAAPPLYHLPPYQLAHTRHYYPDTHHRPGRTSTDTYIDAFAVLGDDATLYVTWEHATLTDPQLTALERVCLSIPYLGRAESLTEARIHKGPLPGRPHAESRLLRWNDSGERPPGTEMVQLLVPDGPLNLDALTLRPADIRPKHRLPPNTCHLPYAVPVPATHRRPTSVTPRAPVTAVRLAITGSHLPPLTQTLPLTDALRATCIRTLTEGEDEAPTDASTLAGKESDGSPMTGHRHTHFLPRSSDGRRTDEVVLWIPGGLSDTELNAIRLVVHHGISTSRHAPGPRDVYFRIADFGAAEHVLPLEWTTPATQWTSTTPFLPPRHRKKNQHPGAYLINEVTRELTHRGLPAPTQIEILPGAWGTHIRHRHRKKEPLAAARSGHGIRITFDQPVSGPISLGRHSHFGLGLFEPSR
ncbi:type I-U CRISPR-associated protein Csb2 [Streptomyces sp. MS19]|uniref:type I-G CRISPR-associated protein Csb2 n=1 Tax=Streptomyces sp. MS19 TaxID=3385972 RepID=UPI0039A3BC40